MYRSIFCCFVFQISSVLSEIIQCDSCNQTRQAAILVIKNIFVCMGHSFKDEVCVFIGGLTDRIIN